MAATNEIPCHYFTNDDGSVKVRAIAFDPKTLEEVKKDIEEYKWVEKDFLLASFPKNGTHFMWEIMTMLLRGSAEYIKDPKVACMMDMFPLKKTDAVFPSPRVLNTHYRLDVLPKEFRGRKTVLVVRNPKDTSVSAYHHEKNIHSVLKKDYQELTFSQYLKSFMEDKARFYGRYFDYIEYMWSLKDDPNMLVIFYEDLIMDPVANIQKVNEFMGTQRSPELVEKIASATTFDNMKEGKAVKTEINPKLREQMSRVIQGPLKPEAGELGQRIYRKGKIGDWKNHLTVAENEMFDEYLAKWPLSKEIKFTFV